jgi:hypothetical protein
MTIASIGHANLLPMLGWYFESKTSLGGGEEFRSVLMMDIREIR